MNVNWTEVFVKLGGSGLFLAAVGWLIRTILTDRLARDAEEFKTKLQTDADAQMEHLKTSLQMTALEHQVRFSKLHEKQAEVIAEVYSQVVIVSRNATRFIMTSEGSPIEELRANYKATTTDIDKLIVMIDTRRIYIPANACELLDKFSRAMGRTVFSAGAPARFNSQDPRVQQANYDALTKAMNVAASDFPIILSELEQEFRRILGEAPSAAR
jgi:hypothetical protein